jgi:hypothetical protein
MIPREEVELDEFVSDCSLMEMSKLLPTSWDEQVIFDEMVILSANLNHSA